MDSKRNYHIEIGGLPIVLGPSEESIAAGSSSFANRVGSAGGYDDDNFWSVGLVTDFSTGIGKTLVEEGFYYAQVDTRRPSVVLPPRVNYTTLTTHALATVDNRTLANRAYYVEVKGRIYLLKGHNMYQWNENNLSFQHKLTLDICVTSAVYFDGYIHIAGRRNDGNMRYKWMKIRGGSFQVGDGPTDITDVYIFYVFGGLLYAARGDEITYTAGSDTLYGEDGFPNLPGTWDWHDSIKVGGYGENINGIAGLIYQSLGQSYLYISTRSYLNVLIPGDVNVGMTEWPMSGEDNGVNMRAFYNRIMTPVGKGLVAIQTNGDLIDIGLDNGQGLPCSLAGRHQDIVTTANYPMAIVAGDTTTVYANKASGWHFVAHLRTGAAPVNGFHSATIGRSFVAFENGTVAHWYTGDTTVDPRTDSRYEYELSGTIDSGWYRGSLLEAKKYWHSVFVDADCINDGSTIEVRYINEDDDDCSACEDNDYESWHLAGYITNESSEVELDPGAAYEKIRFVIIMRTTNPGVSPVVRAYGVRYTPRIVNRMRWSFNMRFPHECLNGIDGSPVPGYDQDEYDCAIHSIVTSAMPVAFADIDGREYTVLVSNGQKRTHGVRCSEDGIVYDVDWSLNMIQVTPRDVACA